MKIFIDFDDVLFNTKNFIADLKNIFYSNGVSEEIFKRFYYAPSAKSRKEKFKKYDPLEQISRIEKEVAIDAKKIKKEISKLVKNTRKYVFPDAINFLKEFKKIELHIISFGDNKFQRKKIKNSGIIEYFNSVNIFDGSKSCLIKNIAGKEKNIFFFDDRARFINDVKKCIPETISILVKRKEGRFNDKKNKYCDFKVSNFKEALKIIK